MADAIDAALRFVKDRARADLDTDEMLLFALVRAVEVVGEAAAKVSPQGREAVNLPWAAVIASFWMSTMRRSSLPLGGVSRVAGGRFSTSGTFTFSKGFRYSPRWMS